MTTLESYKFREAAVKKVDEDTLYVEPHGNCVFFNSLAEDEEWTLGNIGTVEMDGDTFLKVNVSPVN